MVMHTYMCTSRYHSKFPCLCSGTGDGPQIWQLVGISSLSNFRLFDGIGTELNFTAEINNFGPLRKQIVMDLDYAAFTWHSQPELSARAISKPGADSLLGERCGWIPCSRGKRKRSVSKTGFTLITGTDLSPPCIWCRLEASKRRLNLAVSFRESLLNHNRL